MAIPLLQSSLVVRLDVGGTPFHTSLATVMEGARQGSDVFKSLCTKVLGNVWERFKDGSAVPSDLVVQMHECVHFVDGDGQVYSAIINYLRHGKLPTMETASLRDNVRREAGRTGLAALEGMFSEQSGANHGANDSMHDSANNGVKDGAKEERGKSMAREQEKGREERGKEEKLTKLQDLPGLVFAPKLTDS